MQKQNTVRGYADYTFQLYDRPGLQWPPDRRVQFVKELRTCASRCLTPLPDYQCLSLVPTSLNDKLIVVARYSSPSGPITAFFSAILFTIPSFEDPTKLITVLHTGLTCIAPEARRSSLTILLCAHVFRAMIERHPSGFWVTSLTEVPSGLVSLARYAADVFPSPQAPQPPSRTHVHIARNVSERFREALVISADAVFDEERFVFRGSNPPGSCFRKDADDEKWHHRDKELNEFYRQLLGSGEGNEVLQVGYMTREKVLGPLQQEERLQQVRRHKTKL